MPSHQRSVAEVALAGEDHGDAVLVGGGDHLVVAHRAARLARPWPRRRRQRRRGRRGTGRTRRWHTHRRPPARRPSRRRSGPSRPGSAARRRCRRPGRPRTNTMAFDDTAAATRQASSRSAHCSSVGATFVTTRQAERSTTHRVGAPARGGHRRSTGGRAPRAPGRRRRQHPQVLLGGQHLEGVVVDRQGPRRTSVNTGASASARARGTGRLRATMPPKADTGSPAWAPV